LVIRFWIPGSRAGLAPRNDGEEVDRAHVNASGAAINSAVARNVFSVPNCPADQGRRVMTVMTKPQASFKLEPVHPKPEEAHTMPYAPAVRIVGACDLMFLSGATPSPLYHKHPHVDAEHVHPHSIEEQTDRAMAAIQSILDETGATWRDVVKVTKYLTDFRDADAMHATMAKYFGDWRPASTTVCINQLSSPGARVELDMIVALPRKG
jgi:enamine deaminase RidA (YjgF/YER057c/UK114 family)